MKKRNSVCEYIPSRNRNLRREFLSLLGTDGLTVRAIFQRLTSVGADRFYISEERACHLVRRKLNNGPWRQGPLRNKMIEEITRRAEALMKSNPSLSLQDAVFQVVNSPAPSFYLTYSTIRSIIYAA